ncbi:MAG: hypothetical protein H8Z69_02950 [Nanohaloarchaea archaeon]|nr:hypothetical protein [Candidatus Nanohaloarchaea archaeon]
MNNKIKAILASFFVQISTVAAQNDPIGVASGSGDFQGLIPLMSDIFGLQIGGWQDVAVFGATIGVFWLSFYIVIETALRRMGNDYLLKASGLDESYNSDGGMSSRVALFSLLLVVSAFGANGVFGIIEGLQGVILFAMGFGLLGAILWAIGGGLIFSGMGAKVAGEGTKEWGEAASGTKQYLEDAVENMNAGGGNQEEHLEKAIQDIKNAETDVEEMLEIDIQRIEDIAEEIKEEIRFEEDEIEDEREIQQVIKDIRKKIDNAERVNPDQRRGRPEQIYKSILGFNDQNGTSLEKDLQVLHSLLKNIDGDQEGEISEIEDEVQAIEETVEELEKDFQAVRKLGEIIRDSEAHWENIRERMGSDEELALEESQIEKLEGIMQGLGDLESQAIAELEQLENLLEKQITLGEEEIKMLSEEISESKGLEAKMEDLENTMVKKLDGDADVLKELGRAMRLVEEDIMPELQRIDNLDEKEVKNESKALERVREAISTLSQ